MKKIDIEVSGTQAADLTNTLEQSDVEYNLQIQKKNGNNSTRIILEIPKAEYEAVKQSLDYLNIK